MNRFSRFSKVFRPFRGVFEYLRNALSKSEEARYADFMADASSEYRKEIPWFPFICAYVAHPYTEAFAFDLKRFKYRAERATVYGFDESLRRLAAICRDKVPRGAFVAYPPSPASRTLIRWYDHTALLAELFAKHAGLPVVRLVKTPFFRSRQAGWSRSERSSNVVGKYFLPSWASVYSGRPAVFFDDVVSTASTAMECAKILADNGNAEIYGFFLSSPTVQTVSQIVNRQLTSSVSKV